MQPHAHVHALTASIRSITCSILQGQQQQQVTMGHVGSKQADAMLSGQVHGQG